MSDSLLAFMFICMVISPCLAARLICRSTDHAAMVFAPVEAD